MSVDLLPGGMVRCPIRLGLALGLVGMTTSPLGAQTMPGYGSPVAVLVSGPEVGSVAPDFSLPWAGKDGVGGDQWFSLSGQRGKVVVLAFYPKDFTSGCTAEMKTFSDQYGGLFGDDVVVVGINADSVETHARFAASLELPFKLLSDLDQAVAKAYGSADKGGYDRRTVYVITAGGDVAYRDLQFGALNQNSYTALKAAVQAARR